MTWLITKLILAFLFLVSLRPARCWTPSSSGKTSLRTTPLSSNMIRRRFLRHAAGGTVAYYAFALLKPGPPYAIDEQAPLEEKHECDEACREDRLRSIRERRAMMQQSRSTRSRQEVFDLSRQRAALYNTTYEGTSCVSGIPCL